MMQKARQQTKFNPFAAKTANDDNKEEEESKQVQEYAKSKGFDKFVDDDEANEFARSSTTQQQNDVKDFF